MVRYEGNDTSGTPEPHATAGEVRGLIAGIDEELAQQGMLPVAEDSIAVVFIDIAREVRGLFEARQDVKDAGTVDANFVKLVGVDICSTPDFLEVLVDEAKSRYADTEGRVKVEDLVHTYVDIETSRLQRRQAEREAKRAGIFLYDHGISEQEIRELLETNPAKLRLRARLLDAPILGDFMQRVAADAAAGEHFSLDEITVRALAILRRYNRQQEALEAGDPKAIERREELLRDPRMSQALGEMLLRQEFELDKPPADIPDPGDV